MVKVRFTYKDRYTHGRWSTQECVVRDVEEAKKLYGLGEDPDCEWEIIRVEEIDDE